jgi:hypothetical protein
VLPFSPPIAHVNNIAIGGENGSTGVACWLDPQKCASPKFGKNIWCVGTNNPNVISLTNSVISPVGDLGIEPSFHCRL